VSAELADWVYAQLVGSFPSSEPIFDAIRVGTPNKYVVLYCPRPKHDVVTLAAGKDQVDVTFTVHSFGTTRAEVDWRQKRVAAALKNLVPAVDGYEYGQVEHPISRLEGPDYSVPDRVILYGVDQFHVGGFEA